MDTTITKTIKIPLAVLLFACLIEMPYGFYQLVRFLALVGFGILAYSAHKNSNETEMWVYIGLAILFQPIFKISLGRTIWNIVDVVVGAGLLLSLLKKRRNE